MGHDEVQLVSSCLHLFQTLASASLCSIDTGDAPPLASPSSLSPPGCGSSPSSLSPLLPLLPPFPPLPPPPPLQDSHSGGISREEEKKKKAPKRRQTRCPNRAAAPAGGEHILTMGTERSARGRTRQEEQEQVQWTYRKNGSRPGRGISQLQSCRQHNEGRVAGLEERLRRRTLESRCRCVATASSSLSVETAGDGPRT